MGPHDAHIKTPALDRYKLMSELYPVPSLWEVHQWDFSWDFLCGASTDVKTIGLKMLETQIHGFIWFMFMTVIMLMTVKFSKVKKNDPLMTVINHSSLPLLVIPYPEAS